MYINIKLLFIVSYFYSRYIINKYISGKWNKYRKIFKFKYRNNV